MTFSKNLNIVENRWDETKTESMSESELLLYRSNLLGSDLRVTNYGGGNTSAKIEMKDPLTGEKVEILWVKGSGGDLGSMNLDGFATLYRNKLFSLKKIYEKVKNEDEMVKYYPHCTYNLNPRPASIDTPLHAFIPYKHIDHIHPDSVIAIAASKNGEKLTEDIFDGELGWIPWQRPGFDLGLKLGERCKKEPNLKGLVLGGHGFFAWGKTSKECYDKSIEIIRTAEKYIKEKSKSKKIFGGAKFDTLNEEERKSFIAKLMPALRGKLSKEVRKIGHYNDSKEVLEFVNSYQATEYSQMGTSCPDHFLRTKIKPLFIDYNPDTETVSEVLNKLDNLLEQYYKDYKSYYEKNKEKDSPSMRDAYPVVILIPSVGMLTFAKDKKTARVSGEFYLNAINVMRGASVIDEYTSLSEKEAFNIEYWALEEAKLKRMPKPKSLAGKVAVVTGGAGGIGKACAVKMLEEGACVVLSDIDKQRLCSSEEELKQKFGNDNVWSVLTDITDEKSVIESINSVIKEYGGIDLLVSSAGIASASPYEETTMDIWNKNLNILTTGYFIISREVFQIMKEQNLGGSIVFIGSKNALIASPNAAAYCTAKAAEIHLARCIAAEGAQYGIRANSVNPDAVLKDSKIWSGKWRKERAEAYNIKISELEEFYRKRSMLKLNILPEDIAEAVYFFISDKSAKSTGNIINVDSGNIATFTR